MTTSRRQEPEVARAMAEMAVLTYVISDIGSLEWSAVNHVDAMRLWELRARYEFRYSELHSIWEAAGSPPSTTAVAGGETGIATPAFPPLPAPPGQGPISDVADSRWYEPEWSEEEHEPLVAAAVEARPQLAPRVPGPSLAEIGRRFVTAHAIVLMSYVGAFLLIVAALLFLLYGPAGMPGGFRLATVAVVNGILAGAAVICLRRPALRLVATSYTAIAALMFPVTLTSAYEFVVRHATPLTGTAAIAMGGVACAVLYGLTARALGARAYAALSLLALAVAGVAGAVASDAGASALPVAAVYVAGCWAVQRTRDRAFAQPSMLAGHAAAVLTILAAIWFAGEAALNGATALAAYLPLSLATLAAAYAVRYLTERDDLGTLIAGGLLSAAAVAATQSLGWGGIGASAGLITVGVATAVLSTFRPRALRIARTAISSREMALGIAGVAALELAVAALIPIPSTEAQLILIPAAVGGALVVAWRQSAWWLAGGLATLAFQVAVHAHDQPLLPVTPAYIAVALAVLCVATAVLGAVRRDRTLAAPAAVTFIGVVLALGGALQSAPDAFAVSLIAAAFGTCAASRTLGVRVLDTDHRGERALGIDNTVAWVGATATVVAGLFPIANPVVQCAVLIAATVCGMSLVLLLDTPAWVITGLATLAAQAAVDSNSIARAGVAPAYVPLAFAGVALACAATAFIQRDRRVVIAAELALIAGVVTAGSTIGWPADAYSGALAGVAGLCALLAWMLPLSMPLSPALGSVWHLMNNVGAWLSALTVVVACSIPVSGLATTFVVLTAACGVGVALSLLSRAPQWLAVGLVALIMQTAVSSAAIVRAGMLPVDVPVMLTVLLVSIVVIGVVQRNRTLVIPANLCLTAIAMTANNVAGLGATVYAAELAGLACLSSVTAMITSRTALSTLLRYGAGIRLVIAALVVVTTPVTDTVILAVALADTVWLAYSARRPEWLYLAGAFLACGWYQGATAVHATADLNAALTALSPLPIVYAACAGVVAAVLPSKVRNAWVLPPLAFAVTAALGVDAVAVSIRDWTILSWSLAVQGAAVYTVARTLRLPSLVYVAAGAFAGAAWALLAAIDAPLVTYPIALATVAWAIRVIGFTEVARRAPASWILSHQWSAIAVAVLASAAPIANAAYLVRGGSGTLAELVASLSLALVVAAGVAGSPPARNRAVAVLIASLAILWIPVFLGIGDAQAYVALPAAALVGFGLASLNNAEIGTPHLVAHGIVALGATAAMLTTFAQSLNMGVVSWYTVVLLVEGLTALGLAIAFRSRELSVAGAAAAAAAAACALVEVVESVPLYAVFGGAAVLIMVLATILATQRPRIHDARETLSDTWRAWGSS